MLTQKQELFTQNIFSGMTQRDAWIKAGYSSNYPVEDIDSNACTLANSTKIKQRYQELIDASTSPLVADAQERKEILSEIARGKLSNFIECGQDGAWINIDRDKMNTSALQSIDSKTIYNEDGASPAVVTKIKLHNPVPAIDLLNKMDQLYDDRTPTGTTFITSFNFILPDGTKVTPKQLKEGIHQEE